MDQKCVVFGCRNSSFSLLKQKPDCLLYPFPVTDQDLTRRWLEKLDLEGWSPGPENRICEEHFASDEFDFLDGKKVLKSDSIPSLMNNLNSLIQSNISDDEVDSVDENLAGVEVLRCRICARCIPPMKAIHIYSKGERIIEKIMACIPIPLKVEDNLPKHLCKSCLHDLDISYKMLVRAIESEKFFRGLISNLSEKINEDKTIEPSMPLDIQDTQTSCVICDMHFDSALVLREHFEDRHVSYQDETIAANQDTQNVDPDDHFCSMKLGSTGNLSESVIDENSLDSYSNNAKVEIIIPDRIQFQETGYWCEICLLEYRTEELLKNHLEEAHIVSEPCDIKSHEKTVPKNCQPVPLNCLTPPKEHICKICLKKFATKVSLNNHVRVHTGERPYKCSECDKSFRSNSNLLQHKVIHTGIKNYECSICGKSFSRKLFLENHFRIHTGDRPFGCDICGNKFTQVGDLRRHLKRHKLHEVTEKYIR